MSTADRPKFPDHSPDDLLARNKEDLERIKLAQDIHRNYNTRDPERSRFWRETWRLLLVAVVSGVITIAASYFVEGWKSTLKAQEIKQEHYEDERVKCLGGAAIQKVQCFCDLNDLGMPFTGPTAKTYQAQNDSACAILKRSTLAMANKLSHADSSAIDPSTAEFAEMKQGQEKSTDLARAQLVKDRPELKNVLMTQQIVEHTEGQVAAFLATVATPIKNDGRVIDRSGLLWFKKNYYLKYGKIRVVLDDLGEKEIIVLVRTNDAAASIIGGKVPVRIGKSAILEGPDGSNERYRITLESIGHAGANPFKPAAYVRFETLAE